MKNKMCHVVYESDDLIGKLGVFLNLLMLYYYCWRYPFYGAGHDLCSRFYCEILVTIYLIFFVFTSRNFFNHLLGLVFECKGSIKINVFLMCEYVLN